MFLLTSRKYKYIWSIVWKKKTHTIAKMSKQVSLVWTGSQRTAQSPLSYKMFSLTSSDLRDGWCSDVLRFPKRMEACGSAPPSVCSEKVPSASLPWLVTCNTSQHTQQTLLWPWPTSSTQTWALHIRAAPPYEGQPYSSSSLPASPEGLVPISHSTAISPVPQECCSSGPCCSNANQAADRYTPCTLFWHAQALPRSPHTLYFCFMSLLHLYPPPCPLSHNSGL